jgi:sec-independent protein translocase protein TatA
VLAIVLIHFGVGKLSQVGGALGKSIREFREASESHASGEEAKTQAADQPRVEV